MVVGYLRVLVTTQLARYNFSLNFNSLYVTHAQPITFLYKCHYEVFLLKISKSLNAILMFRL